MRQCKICEKNTRKRKDQKLAYWATSWCEYDSGYLCPACHEAARQLKSLEDDKGHAPIMRAMAWGSDIAEASKAVTKEMTRARRAGESFFKWNAENNPELYTEAERRRILGRE